MVMYTHQQGYINTNIINVVAVLISTWLNFPSGTVKCVLCWKITDLNFELKLNSAFTSHINSKFSCADFPDLSIIIRFIK